ncbi:Ig-like domain-containing protein, partial [Stenotrophomonas sp. GbtcB23]|uniref:Ig-like domain-containing protein n=1 Tax=Stenotrophomonas sp. GbtcB23 TaxID=2824768 RepID=UPI0031F30926
MKTPAGDVIGTATVGEDGTFTVPLDPAQTNGEELEVVAKDPPGNESPPVTVEAPDITDPVAPTDLVVSPDGTGVTGTGEP